MAISVQEAMSAYGYVFNVANSIPDLKTILDQAINEGWTAQRLQASIESSPWWMQHADTARNLAFQQFAEPGTYNQSIANARELIFLKAAQMGRMMDFNSATILATRTLIENASFDDQRLGALIAGVSPVSEQPGGALNGQAASLEGHMTKLAEDYGVPFTKDFVHGWLWQVQSGANTLDGFESLMRARAKATYPPLADQIDAGMTIRDIADPYIQTYAKTLEVPDPEVTLNDPYIQRALTQRTADGTASIQPLWQFARQLKDDPRYDRTIQAKDDAFSTLAQVGKDFGFEGAQ